MLITLGGDKQQKGCRSARHAVVLSCAVAAAWSSPVVARLSNGREGMTVSRLPRHYCSQVPDRESELSQFSSLCVW